MRWFAAFRTVRPAVGLERRILRRVSRTLGRAFATVGIAFERDAQPGRDGRPQQTWLRTVAGWRVIAAPASVMSAPSA